MIIPNEVKEIIKRLKERGFEAYIVGGCVRDFLLGKKPSDWDITTNARPEEIREIFPDSFYENKFLTVTVRTGSEDESVKEVEVTTYRLEARYSDKRHPDKVERARNLEEDLARRDFTVNAMAMDEEGNVIDLFGGREDLERKLIRAVGNADERFGEDALRMLRAVRLAVCLSFSVEEKTAEGIKRNAVWIKEISQERIRDEVVKIIMSERAAEGVELLRVLGLLENILPELLEGYGVSQNKHHIYDCYEHAVKSLEYAAKRGFGFHVRMAALLHDVAKPRVKAGEGPDATFYNHEIVGAKMVFEILNRLKFPKDDVAKITKLARYHLFYYNVGEVSESAVRRLVRNVGRENIDELLEVRMADRVGSGVPKAEPYKLRYLRYLVEKVSRDPISVRMVAVGGDDVMRILGIAPSPKVGYILNILLKIVLDDPSKNKKEVLEKEIKKLGSLSESELEKLAKEAKEEINKIEIKRDEMSKKKYWVT